MAPAKPGDLLITDEDAGPANSGAILRVDPATGVRTPVAQGPPLSDPSDLAIGRNGEIYVIDYSAGTNGAVLRIDPATGAATIIFDWPTSTFPFGIATGPDGNLYVVDSSGGTGSLFRLDPLTGVRTTVAEGPPFEDPVGVDVAPDGQIYVADFEFGPDDCSGGGCGAIFRVDPAGGSRTTLASGPPLSDPLFLALTPDGRLNIADDDSGPADCGGSGCGAVFGLRPGAALTTVAAGTPIEHPVGVAQGVDGALYIVDLNAGPTDLGSVIRVDPVSGTRAIIAEGAPFRFPEGIEIEPPLCRGKPATIVGSTGADSLTGSAFADVIVGLQGKDRIASGNGNDLVCGGAGKDVLRGGAGKDTLAGEKGNDKLKGGKGKDRLIGGKGRRDRCAGGKGKDKGKGCERGKV